MSVAEADQAQAPVDKILEVSNLRMYFPITEGVMIQRKVADVKAVDDISFFMYRGETLGLVGESGCGKTTTGRCILQLEKQTTGDIIFNGENISKLSRSDMLKFRQKVQVIFQDPYSSLNPRMKIGQIIGEPMKVHGIIPDKEARDRRVAELYPYVV